MNQHNQWQNNFPLKRIREQYQYSSHCQRREHYRSERHDSESKGQSGENGYHADSDDDMFCKVLIKGCR